VHEQHAGASVLALLNVEAVSGRRSIRGRGVSSE
jgi:hypothetical protein